MRPGQIFRLGRNCALAIDGTVMVGAEDVSLRVVHREIDLTPFGSPVACSVATHRSLEVTLTSPDLAVTQFLRQRMDRKVGDYYLPVVVEIEFFNGIYHGNKFQFTIVELDSDEPLNGVVRSRFLFKQFYSA